MCVSTLTSPELLGQAGDSSSPADTSSGPEHKTRLSGYPYAYYTPETELAVGLGGIVTFYTGKEKQLRPSKLLVSGYWATTGQSKVTLNPQAYFGGNKWWASLNMWYGHIVDKYWGIGNATPETGTESYVSDVEDIFLEVQGPPPLHRATRIGGVIAVNHTAMADRRDNALLKDTTLVGVNGGWATGLGISAAWDNRDNTFFPNRGRYDQLHVIGYFEGAGGDFAFSTYELDARRYYATAPDRVIAVQAYGNFATGNIPFYKLPALGGGNRLRGYYLGRYRDKDLVSGQVEYRTYVWGRLGVVAFAGAAQVSPTLRLLTLSGFHGAVGGGLRFLFNKAEKVNLRADVGFGRGTNGVTFGLEEAF
jgi:hypothetical protein